MSSESKRSGSEYQEWARTSLLHFMTTSYLMGGLSFLKSTGMDPADRVLTLYAT